MAKSANMKSNAIHEPVASNGRTERSTKAAIRKGLIITSEGRVITRIPELAIRLGGRKSILARLAELRASGKLPTNKKK